MQSEGTITQDTTDFRAHSSLAVALTGVFIMAPFAVNHFIQGRTLLGMGSSAIVVILMINAWYLNRGRPTWALVLYGLVPAILFFILQSFLVQGVIGAFWCFPAVTAVYCMLPQQKAWLANLAILIVSIMMAMLVLEHSLAVRIAATLLSVSVFTALFVRIIDNQHEKLRKLAETDPLTGLYNRVSLQASLQQAAEHSRRTGIPMTLVSMDIDHFKNINDTHGHDAGDIVLRGLGGLIRKRIRKTDKAFRQGGEEFLLLLYSADQDNGLQLAEDLRRQVSTARLLHDHDITASFGVAQLLEDDTESTWLKRSDKRLYQAKQGGRNRVVG